MRKAQVAKLEHQETISSLQKQYTELMENMQSSLEELDYLRAEVNYFQ